VIDTCNQQAYEASGLDKENKLVSAFLTNMKNRYQDFLNAYRAGISEAYQKYNSALQSQQQQKSAMGNLGKEEFDVLIDALIVYAICKDRQLDNSDLFKAVAASIKRFIDANNAKDYVNSIYPKAKQSVEVLKNNPELYQKESAQFFRNAGSTIEKLDRLSSNKKPEFESVEQGMAEGDAPVDHDWYRKQQERQTRAKQKQQGVAEGVAETLPMDDAVKVLRQYGAGHFKTTSNELHFYKQGRPFSVDLIFNNDATRSVSISQLNSATRKLKSQGVAEEQLDELSCWSGYTRVQGVPAGAPGSCKKKTNEEDVAEATGDEKFDKMIKGITGKKAVAKQQKIDTKQQARDAFGGMFGGGNPADKLSIRKKGVAEGEYDSRKPFGVRYKVFAGREGRVTTKEYWTTSSEKLEKAVAKIEALGNFYEIDGYSYPKEKQGVGEGMMDNPGDQDSPVAQAIVRRILMQRTDLLAKHGPEKVGQAVDEVADSVGDVDEIGSSDVSGWVRHVEQMLGNMEEDVAEGNMLSKIKAPAAPSSPALAAPRAPAVAETLRQIDRMLESVNSKKSAEIVRAYADQQFAKLGLRNTTECKQIMAHVVHESAVRRRAYAQRMAK
jgi:hypothetical protein